MDLGKVQLGADLVCKAKLEGGKMIVQFEFAAGNVLDAAVDAAEKAIPGDQAALAAIIKANLKAILGN